MTSNPGPEITRFDKIKQGLFHEAKKFLAVSILRFGFSQSA